MEMKSLIVSKIDPTVYVNPDFADLVEAVPNPVYHLHTDSGKEYSHLIGGICWPVFGSQEGCVLILGSSRDEIPTFEVIDEFFSDSPRELLRACFSLRDKYGFRLCSQIFQHWIGEDRFQSQLYEVNLKAERKHVHLTPPPDFDKPNSDEIYIEQIRSVSADGRLIIPSAVVLDRMKALTMFDADAPLVNTPVAACIGYLLHEMLTYKPWQVNTDTSFALDDDHDESAACNLE